MILQFTVCIFPFYIATLYYVHTVFLPPVEYGGPVEGVEDEEEDREQDKERYV